MKKDGRSVLGWFLGAFLVPPITWLLAAWFFRLWDSSEMVKIAVAPNIPLYVLVFVAGLYFYLRRRLRTIEVYHDEPGEDRLEAAQKTIAFVPRFFVVIIAVYTTVGNFPVLAGKPYIDRTEFLLALSLGIPIVFLFAVPFFVVMMAKLERWSAPIPRSKTYRPLSLAQKLFLLFIFNVVGVAFIYITGATGLTNASGGNLHLSELLWKFGTITAVILTFTILNLYLLRSQMLGPITRMYERVEFLSRGEGDLTSEIPVETTDELGDLSLAFNRLLVYLRGLFSLLLGTTTRLRGDLNECADQTGESVDRITDQITVVSGSYSQLSTMLEDSTSTVGEIAQSIESAAGVIDEQGGAIDRSAGSIRETLGLINAINEEVAARRDAVEVLLETSRKGELKINETSNTIQEIAGRIDHIEEMIRLINGIASQTNLLSMNAAIEAAHAGESGKGFAVVAEEIRRLAESSGQNATDIGRELKEIIGTIAAASEAGTETQSVFSDIQDDIEKTLSAFDGVQRSAGALVERTTSVQGDVEELMHSSERVKTFAGELTGHIKRIGQIIANIGRFAADSTEAMEKLSSGTTGVTEATSKIIEMNRDLSQSLGEVENKLVSFQVNSATETR